MGLQIRVLGELDLRDGHTVAEHPVAGSTITVWIDEKGRRTQPPLARAEVTNEVMCAAIATLAGLALLLAAVGGVVSLLLDRHRLACWEADWSAVEPRWTGRR